MNTIEIMREFLGWCSVINSGRLMLSAFLVVLLRNQISYIHTKIFDLDERNIPQAYFQYLAQFKIIIIVFNIVPYFALMIMK